MKYSTELKENAISRYQSGKETTSSIISEFGIPRSTFYGWIKEYNNSEEMALGSELIKIRYKSMSDEDLTKEIVMNPYLQYFLGLREYRYECPFDASMMTRFRQRISAEMLAWVNDEIIGRSTAAEGKEEDHKDNDTDNTGSSSQEESKGAENEEENQGTLILDATCAPQNIRFPTDASLLNEAREKAEEIIDILHKN